MTRHRMIRVPDFGVETERLGVVGEFNRETISFRVTEIPAPPEAREVRIREESRPGHSEDRSSFFGYQIEFGCPHCGKDVDFLYGKRYSDAVLEDIERQEIQARPHWQTYQLIRQILDAYDPDAGAETYMPEGVPR